MNRRQFFSFIFNSLISAQSFAYKEEIQFWWKDLEANKVYSEKKYLPLLQKPGSVMKLVSTAALIQENLVSADQIIECRQQVQIGKQKYTCQFPHGKVNLQKALAHSCNVYFASVLHRLNPKTLLYYSHELGFTINNWTPSPIEELGLGLSENIVVSPAQLLNLSEQIAFKQSKFVKSKTFQFLQDSMRLAALEGTGKKIDTNNSLHLAIKTGTVPSHNNYSSWITGYFPFENPKYVFCIYSPIGTSHNSAIPLTKQKLLKERIWF